MKKISLIIVTYNNETTIKKCLDSIFLYNDIGNQLEVIVIDNQSKDKTTEILNDYSEQIIFKIARENKGFGAGNNEGVKLSSGNILFFLNPDTELVEPIFNRIIEVNKRFSIIGFHLISKNGDNMPSFAPMPERFLYCGFFLQKKYKKLEKKDLVLRNFYPWGAAMVIKKEDFFNAGLFDEKIFLNFEEPDIIKRIKINKICILMNKIIHNESVSKNTFGEVRMNSFYKESEEYYFTKYFGKLHYKLVILTNILKIHMKRIITSKKIKGI